MRIALAALLCLAGLGPARSQPADAEVRCVVEDDCLALMSDLASRHGSVLRLALSGGGARAYDDPPCGEETAPCAAHRLVAYLPRAGAYVVETEGEAGLGALLVDRVDGSEARLFATPSFSPSGQRLVLVANGFPGHGGHEVATWDRRDGRWSETARFGGGTGRPVEAWTLRGWEGEDTIRLDYVLVDPPGASGTVAMRWDGSGWQVLQDPPVSASGLQQQGAGDHRAEPEKDR